MLYNAVDSLRAMNAEDIVMRPGANDLFDPQRTCNNSVRVNIYADEIQGKECHYTKNKWIYIGIIVEDISNPLLDDLISERYCGQFDKTSPYYQKNSRDLHWVDIADADTSNIARRWINYIVDPAKSSKKLYAYVLGINDSCLDKVEFGGDSFNNIYNRFFRSCVLYGVKTFFPDKKIIIENIYHEEGQQEDHSYFPWHIISRIKHEENIACMCNEIQFLPKSQKDSIKSNIIQLADLFLGVSTSILHGVKESKSSAYKKPLIELFMPLFQRMVHAPNNIRSNYKYANRIMIRFFPKHKTQIDELFRLNNQFYTKRDFYYLESNAGQQSFNLNF